MASVVIAAVVAGAGAAASAAIAGTAILSAALVAGASSLVLGGISRALAPEPPNTSIGSTNIKSRGIVRSVRQPITSRKVVYGETRVSGPITFFEQSDNNKYLHICIPLAGHEVEEIGEVWINDYPITDDMLDGNDIVNTGRYDGLIRIRKKLGTTSQTADADLVSETSATTDYRGQGVAYIYVRLEFNRDKFPAGVPNISAWVKGKKLYDTRDAGTRYSPNISLMGYDYISNDVYGLGASSISTTISDSSANICDEIQSTQNIDTSVSAVDASTNIISFNTELLTYQTGDQVELTGTPPTGLNTGTNYYVIVYQRKQSDDTNPRIKLATSLANAYAGTAIGFSGTSSSFTVRKNGEPRYAGGGILDTETDPQTNLEDVVSGMGGRAIYSGGEWLIEAASYATPSLTFTEDHVVSGIQVQTRLSRRERFNTVKGTYVSPLNNGQPSDYPTITNSTYITNDNGVEIIRELDQPFTTRPHTAQRIAKIELEKARQEIAFTADFNLHAMQVRAGDNVQITNSRFGWSSKVFEVTDWEIALRQDRPVIKMSLRETSSSVYDWNNGEETQTDPAPNTDFPNPFNVDPPTGLAVQSTEVATQQSDFTYEFEISWTPPSDIFVTNGGYYEVQFKKSTESTWRRSYRAEDDDTSIRVTQVDPAVNYDCRMRSVNSLGVRSSFQQLLGFSINSPSGATITLDYGLIDGTITETRDFGALTDVDEDELDFGSIV